MNAYLRVLIVEDSQDDAELLLIELRRAGLEPSYERVDTEAAMAAALDRQTWDIVISDYVMPRFSGLAALALLMEKGLDLPFIIVSGKIGEDIAVEAMKAGAHDYIIKGSLSRLVPAIQRELGEAAVRRERRQVEEALRESEARFRRLAENAQDVIFRFELKPVKGFKYISPAVSRLLGCTPDECYAEPELLLRLIHPEDQHFLEKMFEGTDVPKEMNVRWRHVDGHQVWAELHNVLIHDEDGAIVAIEGIARDITEHKQMEARLLRAQRLETAGRIAGQVAHDFNNLLSPLIAYPQLIKRQLPPGHAAGKFCDSLEKAAQQMARINEDLLALGRRGHFNLEPVDVNLIIGQALEKLPDGSAGVQVVLNLAASLPPIDGSEAQLLRVILNLLINAREAMPESGLLYVGTEIVQVDQPFGRYNLVEVGEYVRLQIKDTGNGIAPELLDKIFDPFFTTKRADKHRGSGLGLSIVQGIVSDHRGYVDVESEPGKGTSFMIYLPISLQTAPEMPAERACIGCESILIVDDDELQISVTRELLETLGYEVSTAGSGEEAVSYLTEHEVDLLVLDMAMPTGMNGVETYRRVVEMHPGQRAIILSGYSEPENVREAQALGAGAFLRKPVTLEKLARAVRQELERTS